MDPSFLPRLRQQQQSATIRSPSELHAEYEYWNDPNRDFRLMHTANHLAAAQDQAPTPFPSSFTPMATPFSGNTVASREGEYLNLRARLLLVGRSVPFNNAIPLVNRSDERLVLPQRFQWELASFPHATSHAPVAVTQFPTQLPRNGEGEVNWTTPAPNHIGPAPTYAAAPSAPNFPMNLTSFPQATSHAPVAVTQFPTRLPRNGQGEVNWTAPAPNHINGAPTEQRKAAPSAPNFPMKLMSAMMMYEQEHERRHRKNLAFQWLNGGTSFIVLDQDIFLEDILKKYGLVSTCFQYASFVRKMCRYGFVRQTCEAGLIFRHPLFCRGQVHLCQRIKSQQHSK